MVLYWYGNENDFDIDNNINITIDAACIIIPYRWLAQIIVSYIYKKVSLIRTPMLIHVIGDLNARKPT